MVAATNQVRIIAGTLRGRKITFPEHIELRPTGNRIKETVFNWLGQNIINATCLDSFAGSGALGFEALSRGAHAVTFIEKSLPAIQALQVNGKHFNLNSAISYIHQDTLHFLQQPASQVFDIVFLDPPYQQKILYSTLSILQQYHWVNHHSLIYVEDNQPITPELSTWEMTRQCKAGNVYYAIVILRSR